MSPKKKHVPELKVVFDTNALFTELASNLLRDEIAKLIQKNQTHPDLSITWYLPEIVRHERQFQMSQKALKFLNTIEKLEKLLGHNLNITKEILEQRVEAVINKQLETYGLHILMIDQNKFDLKRMILDAAYRRPPFEIGEDKEKGFRDALVAEAFIQLVIGSPSKSKDSWIVLVTNDSLLASAVRERTSNMTNVRVFNSLEELEGLINTIVSTVDEEFVAAVLPKATKFFFDVENKSTLVYKEKITERIQETYKQILASVPEGAEARENGKFTVYNPRFLKKEGRRLFWATRINVEAKAFKYKLAEAPPAGSAEIVSPLLPYSIPQTVYGGPGTATTWGTGTTLWGPGTTIWGPGTANAPISKQKVLVKTGSSIFEVLWSINRNQEGKLSSPKIDDIKYIETSWSEN